MEFIKAIEDRDSCTLNASVSNNDFTRKSDAELAAMVQTSITAKTKPADVRAARRSPSLNGGAAPQVLATSGSHAALMSPICEPYTSRSPTTLIASLVLSLSMTA